METNKNVAHTDHDMSERRPACIINTEYERLVIAIRRENAQMQKKRGVQPEERRRQVIRAIMSVYYFARIELDMSYRQLTPEEFRIIRQHLKKTAEQVIADSLKSRWRWWRFVSFGRDPAAAWRHYLQYDYFPSYEVPGLPVWHRDVQDFSRYCSFLSPGFFGEFSLSIFHNQIETPFWKKDRFLPPNLRELEAALTEELFKEWEDVSSDATV